ncbi:nicotinamide riboside transporter PnuC [Janthinobacterium sp. BJB1]|uniref:nicotinamide riboside transporter PnuC n=1 Tax=Janthinobacterium sp. GW458P TaxID=1981504 RepID=UPI000A326A62|nr:nicotinamide riboside transporter PnuC [Janthinobacterium sp. GW458P]MBE3027457.1 nicotinamide mononucleotide transporter [Janthinobacterium sp. GW458P]PHV15673.1 nicotinamide riboside transporter PnuC [Janthinobacterium sp. BJB303]PJC96606.1 nicotinamide riboside transporter PnuC [Janthinobacterium sp. BJB1]
MTPPLEIAANVLMTVSIVLAGRNNIHSWWIGMVGCVLFAVLFFQVNLYADVLLQLFFIVTCVIGWLQWRRGASGQPLPITRTGWRSLAWVVPAGFAAVFIYGMLLHRFTNAYAPFIDSAVLVFSVIAQFLLMSRRIETWGFWLLVNTVAVPLYYSRGLYLTAVLYAAYWVNALISWYWWRLQARRAAAAPPAAIADA